MNVNHQKQSIEDWYAQNAIAGTPRRIPVLLSSRTVAEDAETVTDCGYFVEVLTPEASKDGRFAAVLYRETTIYTRDPDGDPDQVMRVETEVLVSRTI